jgi:DNA-binding NarL/FixJ family response regulator
MSGNIRVVIAEDNRLFREGLCMVLRPEKSIRIVGEAANGNEALSVTKDLKPDVLLLDFIMPELDGLEIIPPVCRKCPSTKTIMLKGQVHEDKIFRALELGAKGYISKDASSSDLVKAIQAVHQGELWVERSVMSKIFEALRDDDSLSEKPRKRTKEGLTSREIEVLHHLVSG